MGQWQDKMLSSNSYISVKLRGELEKASTLKVVMPNNCNHAENMCCETAECLNSWSLDWQMFLRRTNRGRAIIKQFELTDDQVMMLESDNFRPIHPNSDPFDAKFDRPPGKSHPVNI